MEEIAVEGHKLIQILHLKLTGNANNESAINRLSRGPSQDNSTVREMLAQKCKEGNTDQVKELFHKFCVEKISDVDPKGYKDLYYIANTTVQRGPNNEFTNPSCITIYF